MSDYVKFPGVETDAEGNPTHPFMVDGAALRPRRRSEQQGGDMSNPYGDKGIAVTVWFDQDNGDIKMYLDMLNETDMFHRSWSGYWMYGVENIPDLGWLARDAEVRTSDEQDFDAIQEVKLVHGGELLDEPYWLISKDVWLKSLKIGLSRWGKNFVNGQCDCGDYDVALQTALFGEVVYG